MIPSTTQPPGKRINFAWVFFRAIARSSRRPGPLNVFFGIREGNPRVTVQAPSQEILILPLKSVPQAVRSQSYLK